LKGGKKASRVRALKKRDEATAAMNRRFLKRIRSAPDRGTGGHIRWSREEMHER
jgi:hypothetical protein